MKVKICGKNGLSVGYVTARGKFGENVSNFVLRC